MQNGEADTLAEQTVSGASPRRMHSVSGRYRRAAVSLQSRKQPHSLSLHLPASLLETMGTQGCLLLLLHPVPPLWSYSVFAEVLVLEGSTARWISQQRLVYTGKTVNFTTANPGCVPLHHTHYCLYVHVWSRWCIIISKSSQVWNNVKFINRYYYQDLISNELP